jgi:hypothetical protein
MLLTVKAPENPSPFTPLNLAGFFASLAEQSGQAHLRQGAGHFLNLVENPTLPITCAQREEVRRLCQHPLLPKSDKTRHLLDYMQDNQEQAAERIRQLQSQLSRLEDLRDND